MYHTPIVYIFFNRPDVVRKTFPAIRQLRPRRLHLIADGPRPTRPADQELCRTARAAVESMLDWECEVTRDYSESNLGCGPRLSSGLTRAFAELGEAVVVEDDVLPHPDFFAFCAEQLESHRDNSQIHGISGFNPLGRYTPSRGQAVPTIFNNIWGWASWQRSWKDYTFDLSEWTDPVVKSQIRDYVDSKLIYNFFATDFDKVINRAVNTWDFQWTFTMLKQKRFALVSSVNLIENLGFAGDATHTHKAEPYVAGLKVYPRVTAPQKRPLSQPDRIHDKLYSEVILTPSEQRIRLARFIARSQLAQTLLASKLR